MVRGEIDAVIACCRLEMLESRVHLSADTTLPTARLFPKDVTEMAWTPLTLAVRYADDVAVAPHSIDANDIIVVGPDGAKASIAVESNCDDRITVRYQVSPPGGYWDWHDNGTYTVRLQRNQVADTSGNYARARALGTFKVSIPRMSPPRAFVKSDGVSQDHANPFELTLVFELPGLDESTLDGSDLRLTLGDQAIPATFAGVTRSVQVGRRTYTLGARYLVSPPTASWGEVTPGDWAVEVQRRQIANLDGLWMPAGKIGTVTIDAWYKVVDGEVQIRGTSGDDWIHIQPAGQSIRVWRNRQYVRVGRSAFNRARIDAGAGNDFIANFPPGVFDGGPGNDVLHVAGLLIGGDGNDELWTEGKSTLTGGRGVDTLRGSSDDDWLDGGANGDVINGGGGIDTVDYSSRPNPLKISLDGFINDGAERERDNVGTDVENVIGGSGGDVIVGSGGPNSILGGGGNDTIYGGAGDDTLVGGGGADVIYGQLGADRIFARDGERDSLNGGPYNDWAEADEEDDARLIEEVLRG